MKTYLRITWGVSRGRDTYGYNICRLADETTGKRFRCMGGGYDMVGTVLADWLVATHPDRLLQLAERAGARWTPADGYQRADDTGRYGDDRAFYGMTFYPEDNRVSIDGACGVESVTRIMRAAGFELTRTWTKRGETTGWIVELSDVPVSA